MTDISLDRMQIRAGGQVHSIPFDPPMQSMRDARERVVKMDQEACTALGRSDITVKEYVPPTGFHLVVFVAAALTFPLLSREQNVAPGSLIHQSVPLFADFVRKIRLPVLIVMLVLHSAEALYMANVKLIKHTVPFMSVLWWKWTASCFIEGVGSFQR